MIKYIEDRPRLHPAAVRANEMRTASCTPGLQDLCVSRTSFK